MKKIHKEFDDGKLNLTKKLYIQIDFLKLRPWGSQKVSWGWGKTELGWGGKAVLWEEQEPPTPPPPGPNGIPDLSALRGYTSKCSALRREYLGAPQAVGRSGHIFGQAKSRKGVRCQPLAGHCLIVRRSQTERSADRRQRAR